MSKSYAGIGSRKAPDAILKLMAQVATVLSYEGWTLRSGHAEGADYAFERGSNGRAEIFLPWPTYNHSLPLLADRVIQHPTPQAREIAMSAHPAWNALGPGAKLLHARNAHQILGHDLNTPVEYAICWTPDGAIRHTSQRTGGTGTALRIAVEHEIPVFNLQRQDHHKFVEQWVGQRWPATA